MRRLLSGGGRGLLRRHRRRLRHLPGRHHQVEPGRGHRLHLFNHVETGEECYDIAARYAISLNYFVKWNPGVGGRGCNTMWADAYVCVGVIG